MFKSHKFRLLLLASIAAITGCTGETESSSSEATVSSSPVAVTPSSSSAPVVVSSSSAPVVVSSSSAPVVVISSSSAPVVVASSSQQPPQSSSAPATGGDHPGKTLYFRDTADGGCVECHGPAGDGKGASKFNLPILDSLAAGTFETATVQRMPFGVDAGLCDTTCSRAIQSWLVDGDQPPSSVSSTQSSGGVSSSVSVNSSSSSEGEYKEETRFVSFLAVDVGASEEFEARSKVVFQPDQGGSGGDTSDQSAVAGNIPNTEDDRLFYTERWGEFDYSFSVENGLYAVQIGFIELVQDHAAGSRVFNVLAEGEVILSDIDIVKEKGAVLTPLIKEVKNIEVKDGKLDLSFQKKTHNATASFINIKKVEDTPEKYNRMCGACHNGPTGPGTELGHSLVKGDCEACEGGVAGLSGYIESQMPFQFAKSCVGECATEMANYILDNFAGYGNNPPVEIPVRLNRAGDASACSSGQPDIPLNLLRRVAQADYQGMVSNLFSIEGDFVKGFSIDEQVGSFTINSKKGPATAQVVRYFDMAEIVTKEAMKNKSAWMPCSATNNSCAEQTIEKIGRKAFRRPLSPTEKSGLMSVYSSGSSTGFDRGIELAMQAILVSPNFLYFVEQGEGSGDVVSLTQYEIAARLALFIWKALPDDILLDAAKDGLLQTDDQIRAQAERMLKNKRAEKVTALFHKEWLHIKTPTPGAVDFDVQAAAMEGFDKTIASVIFDDKGSHKDLFTVDYGFVNGETKSLYGAAGSSMGSGGDGFDKFLLGSNRKGILTRLPFLRSNGKPVLRGDFLRQEVLCGVIPPAPPTAADALESDGDDPEFNPRQVFGRHTQDSGCAGCHALMDPLGFPFDNFDDRGNWRTNYGFDDKFTVDDSGSFIGTLTENKIPFALQGVQYIGGTAFNGGVEMQEVLSDSADLQVCYAFKWFEYGVGRDGLVRDACSLHQVQDMAFNKGTGSVQDLITAIVLSDSFRNLRKKL